MFPSVPCQAYQMSRLLLDVNHLGTCSQDDGCRALKLALASGSNGLA